MSIKLDEYAISLLIALGISGGCCPGGEEKVPNEGHLSPLQKTVVSVEGHDQVITLNDGEEMRHALLHYLKTSNNLAEIPFLTNEHEAWIVEGDRPRIDQDGQLHIGLWLLQSKRNNLVLVYRAPPGNLSVGYQYVAHLKRTEGRWEVPTLTFEKLYYRR